MAVSRSTWIVLFGLQVAAFFSEQGQLSREENQEGPHWLPCGLFGGDHLVQTIPREVPGQSLQVGTRPHAQRQGHQNNPLDGGRGVLEHVDEFCTTCCGLCPDAPQLWQVDGVTRAQVLDGGA